MLLTPENDLTEIKFRPSEEQAEFYKNLGNSAFMKNNFNDAINYYTKAINFSISPSAVYFGYVTCYRKLPKKIYR